MTTPRTKYKLFPAANYFKSGIVRTEIEADNSEKTFIFVSGGSIIADGDNQPAQHNGFPYTISNAIPRAGFTSSDMGIKNDNGIFLLPNGYFFKTTYYRTIFNYHTPQETKSEEKKRVDLENFMIRDRMSFRTVDSFIDTGAAAIVKDQPGEHVICGVNTDRNMLVTYQLVPSQSYIYPVFERGHRSESYELCREQKFKEENELIGNLIFKAPEGKKIASFAGFPGLPDQAFAISFTDGEIIFGNIKDNHFVQNTQLQQPNQDFANAQLLASPQGMLIVHSKELSILRVWDLQQSIKHTNHHCPEIFNLNIASSGNYFTALEGKDNSESDILHSYELPSFKHHVVKLEQPVQDFVLGFKDEVVMLADKLNPETKEKEITRLMPGHFNTLLQKPAAPKQEDKKPTVGARIQTFFGQLKKHDASKDAKAATPSPKM